MERNPIYKILDIPIIYRLCGLILAPGGNYFLIPKLKKYFDQSKGDILDLGCGPRTFYNQNKSKVKIVGFDLNQGYLLKYRTHGRVEREPASCAADVVCGSADRLPFADNSFDEVRSCALFHHLSDEQVVNTIRELYRIVRPGGRLIIFDAVFPKNKIFRPLAFITLSLDRGRYMRSENTLSSCLFSLKKVKWNVERFTYSLSGLEGIIYSSKITKE